MRLKTKFLFLSNKEPKISSAPSDIRRAIICDMAPFQGNHDPNYQDKLNAEIEAIVNFCLAKYQEIAGARRLIPVKTNRVKELADENEAYLDSIIERSFDFESEAFIKRSTFQGILHSQGFKSGHEVKMIKDRIKREFGVNVDTHQKRGKDKVYFGIKPRKAFTVT